MIKCHFFVIVIFDMPTGLSGIEFEINYQNNEFLVMCRLCEIPMEFTINKFIFIGSTFIIYAGAISTGPLCGAPSKEMDPIL